MAIQERVPNKARIVCYAYNLFIGLCAGYLSLHAPNYHDKIPDERAIYYKQDRSIVPLRPC